MTTADIWNVAAAVVLSLGGSAAIVLALSGWLGKVWANRLLEANRAKCAADLEAIKARYIQELERHKTALKRSELIFQKEFDAASAFVTLVRAIRVNMAHPDIDRHDACDAIAE